MLDGLDNDGCDDGWFIGDKPPKERRWWRPLSFRLGLAALGLSLAYGLSWAQLPPSGGAVLNQGLAARLLTKSDTAYVMKTRGLFIGDATACNIALVFNADTAPVTFLNVQSGAVYPFQIVKLMSASTTCTSVVALY